MTGETRSESTNCSRKPIITNTRVQQFFSKEKRVTIDGEDRNFPTYFKHEHKVSWDINHKNNNYLFGNKVHFHTTQSENNMFTLSACTCLQYLFLRLQPSKVFLFILCLFSLFLFCVDSAPARKNSSVRVLSQSKSVDFTSQSKGLNYKSTYSEAPMQNADFSQDAITRGKRSATASENVAKKTAKRKTRKSKKTKKRRKKTKTKRRTRKTPYTGTKKYMLKIPLHPSRQEQRSSPRRQRLYNSCGNSFHLAVWKNGTVGGEPSNMQSDYSKFDLGDHKLF